jgi:hypothetical protein
MTDMRTLVSAFVALVATVALLAGCGGSGKPTPSPSASASSTTSTTAAACSKAGSALTSLSSLAALKHPTRAIVAAKFRTATTQLNAAAGLTSSASLKSALSRLSGELNAAASQLAGGKLSLADLGKEESRLQAAAAPVGSICGGI